MAASEKSARRIALSETKVAGNVVADLKWTVIADLGATYIVSMPLSTWMSIPNHEHATETVRRTQEPHWEFLRTASGPSQEALKSVVAAEFAGRICKVDGHTRTLLWDQGKLPAPQTVHATVYRCQTREQLLALYTTFDTQSKKEPVSEKIKRAFRDCGLVVTAHRLKGGLIADPLSIAMTGFAISKDSSPELDNFDFHKAVETFKPEIVLLNEINPPQFFQSGVIAAAFIALSESVQHVGFFNSLARGKGQKRGKALCDPIEIMKLYLESLKGNDDKDKEKTKSIANNKGVQADLCARCLAAADLYLPTKKPRGYWSAVPPEPVNLAARVKAVRERRIGAAS